MKKILTIVIIAAMMASCSTTKPGVVIETKRYRITKGNALHFQQRADAKRLKAEKKYIVSTPIK